MSGWSKALCRTIAIFGLFAIEVSTAEAGLLDLSWNAPTTNANGTRLTDLAGYRIYVGTSAPACPGGSHHQITSSTAAPAPGQTVSSRLGGLTGGTTYFFRLTAVDATGSESACSPVVSAPARPDLGAAPNGTTAFGAVAVGGAVDKTFTVQNLSGAALSGQALTRAPFSIVSGASFSLPPGGSQTVVARFTPTTASTFIGSVTFTANGDSLTRTVNGTGTGTVPLPVTLTVAVSGGGGGTVSSPAGGISCTKSCAKSVPKGTTLTLAVAPAAGARFVGWSGGCTGTGACSLTLTQNTSVTANFSNPNNPAPVATSLAPSQTAAGTGALTLTVNGSGFMPGSVVRWSGAALATTFVSASQLRTTVQPANIATAGPRTVAVVNPSPGGGTSAALTFTVVNAVPAMTSLAPSTIKAGSPAFALVVNGRGFAPGAVVRWNGAARTTTFVSSTQLRAAIPGTDVATAGADPVTVFNPGPGGGASAALTFVTTGSEQPVPGLTSLAPSSIFAGNAAFSLVVNGRNFVRGSVVRWNGLERPTTFVSASQLRAAIAITDVAAPATTSVSVVTPAPGGGHSGELIFTVKATNPAPVVSSLTPAGVGVGSAGFTLTVDGAGFVPSSQVRWNGSPRATTFVSASRLLATIPTTDLATVATRSVTVFTATPGGGTSAVKTFAITAVPPSAPAHLTVTRLADAGDMASFRIAWTAVSGAASYRFMAGLNDGTLRREGSATTTSITVQLPRRTGDVHGYVCLWSENSRGQTSVHNTCTGL